MLSLEELGIGLGIGMDIPQLSADWSAAAPFPHLVFDDFLPAEAFGRLREEAMGEPLVHQAEELFQHRGSAEPPASPLLRAFAAELGHESFRAALGAVTRVSTSRVSLRVYRYDRGDYLLPHTDSRLGEQRLLAFAYYLGNAAREPLRGGELDLYECALENGELLHTRVARSIEARPNRLALFAVTPKALHRVREVTRGQRLSLAGWFLA